MGVCVCHTSDMVDVFVCAVFFSRMVGAGEGLDYRLTSLRGKAKVRLVRQQGARAGVVKDMFY